MKEKLAKYPRTSLFSVVDTIGVPHAFCIDAKHVAYASDNFSGQLSEAAITAYEKVHGPSCATRVDQYNRCQLKFEQHEQALLIGCKTKDEEELRSYLKEIVGMCEADGYAGFTLLDQTQSVLQ